MPAPVPRRALIAITSAHVPLGDHMTGLWVTEALHPFEVLRKSGFEVDFVSETGKWAPGKPPSLSSRGPQALGAANALGQRSLTLDELGGTDDMSLESAWLSAREKAVYEDPKSEFRSGLDNIKTPSQLKSSDYGLFFASAGHAALIDYPEAKGIQKIVADIWEIGGIVSAVCHVSRVGAR